MVDRMKSLTIQDSYKSAFICNDVQNLSQKNYRLTVSQVVVYIRSVQTLIICSEDFKGIYKKKKTGIKCIFGLNGIHRYIDMYDSSEKHAVLTWRLIYRGLIASFVTIT